MSIYRGRCHCGSLEIELHSALAAAEFEVRADQCGFCRRHRSRAISDPDGQAIVRVHRSEHLQRYRFGLRTADFLLCRNCGVYVAAFMPDGEAGYAIAIVNALDNAESFTGRPAPVDYDAEDLERRLERRRRNWTPARLVFQDGADSDTA